MGKQAQKTFRGRCESKTFRKDGKPKHAGNFSYETLHAQSRQSKTYGVWRAENGHLMVGEHTPLLCLLSVGAVQFAMEDKTFTQVTFEAQREMFGKLYETRQVLKRHQYNPMYDKRRYEFTYTEEIWTDNDFNYLFENY